MHDAITLLNELDQPHIEWIFDTALTRIFSQNAPIIREGEHPAAL